MNQNQMNKVEMMETTQNFLNTYTNVWITIPIITTYKNQLSQAIDQLKIAALDQDAAQVFIGSSLQALKLTVAGKMDILDDSLEAYAEDIEDAALIAQADNSKTDYVRLPNEAFETKVKNVIALLEEHVSSMADYGFTQDQINDVKLTFSIYQDKRGMPRSYQIASRTATQSIKDLISEGTKALNKLDRVMKRFKRSNTSFYNGYEAARMIVND